MRVAPPGLMLESGSGKALMGCLWIVLVGVLKHAFGLGCACTGSLMGAATLVSLITGARVKDDAVFTGTLNLW